MTKGNPILPSEPLSLQPDLIAEAVLAEQHDSHSDAEANVSADMSSRAASKVKRRLDNRHYGRSESRSRSGDRGRSAERRRRDRSQRSEASPAHRLALGENMDRMGEDHGCRMHRDNGMAPEDNPHGSYHSNGRAGHNDSKNDDAAFSRVLGVFGMSKFTNEDTLHELFGRYGPISKVQVIRDPHEGHSRGFGFVNMADSHDAQRARDGLNDTVVHDRRVRVDFSHTSRAHSPTPGKYKGQDTAQIFHGHRHGQRDNRRVGRQPYYDSPAAYRPRRRANSRDRRWRDQQATRRYAPRDGREWGRSKSPRYYGISDAALPPPPPPPPPPPMSAARSSYDSYRSANYSEHGRGREHDAMRGYHGHSRSRSPPRRVAHGYQPAYHHHSSHGRGDSRSRRQSRGGGGGHRPGPYDRAPSY